MTGSNLTSGTFYDGNNRNYTYLYDKSKYTSLWIAYPLDKSTCTGSNKYSGNWSSTPGFNSADQINVWSDSYYGDNKIVDVNIRRLRMKIEDDPSEPRYIMTIWGYGYKWEEKPENHR